MHCFEYIKSIVSRDEDDDDDVEQVQGVRCIISAGAR